MSSQFSRFAKSELTGEGIEVPRKITDTVDISGHEGHNLCLGSEVIFILLLGVSFRGWPILLVFRCGI